MGTGPSVFRNDGFQFALTQKATQHGKISSPYDPFGHSSGSLPDNHYALEGTSNLDLYQCRVELRRARENSFEATLFNWRNVEVSKETKLIPGNTGTAKFNGLPWELTVGKTGVFGSAVTFEYGDNQNTQAAYCRWNSASEGYGTRGVSRRFCRAETSGTSQTLDGSFPCYER